MFGIGKLLERWAMYRKVSPWLSKLEEAIRMKSWRKAIAAVLGAVVGLLGPKVGLTPEQVQTIVAALMAYILGQGLADFGKNAKKDA